MGPGGRVRSSRVGSGARGCQPPFRGRQQLLVAGCPRRRQQQPACPRHRAHASSDRIKTIFARARHYGRRQPHKRTSQGATKIGRNEVEQLDGASGGKGPWARSRKGQLSRRAAGNTDERISSDLSLSVALARRRVPEQGALPPPLRASLGLEGGYLGHIEVHISIPPSMHDNKSKKLALKSVSASRIGPQRGWAGLGPTRLRDG